MIFTIITKDLQKELKSNLPQIMILLKKQPAIAYKKIGDIGKEVGKKYDIELLVNFPHRGKIENFEIFYPDRIANRILGRGDIVSLVEKASED